jgi:hypothetical protein
MESQGMHGGSQPAGHLGFQRMRHLGDLAVKPVSLRYRLKNFLQHGRRSAGQVGAATFTGRVFGFTTTMAALGGKVYRPDWASLSPERALTLKVLLQARVALTAQQVDDLIEEIGGYVDVAELPRYFGGQVLDYGVLSRRVVTTVGVGYVVDAFQNLVELENMRYHGFGTGVAAEAVGDTALGTELTTQYAVDNTRPTGTTTEGASGNIYRTVATLSPDTGGTIAVTEHGVFSATSAGVLLDRSVFAAVNLVAGADSLQATYDLTMSAGG